MESLKLPPNKVIEGMSGWQTSLVCTSLHVQEPPDTLLGESSRHIDLALWGQEWGIETRDAYRDRDTYRGFASERIIIRKKGLLFGRKVGKVS